jgi:NAD(P)-dependent dehydrogenase (short-subunit alcohol dehydrogenase family)
MRLKDKVAVITGSGRGIGRALAIAMAKEGAKVVINDIDEEPAKEVVETIKKNGGEAVYCTNSVFPLSSAEAIIKKAIDSFGKIDILVNNAGVIKDAMVHKMTEEDFDIVINTHIKGSFCCTKAAYSYMREQKSGRIINITSYAGIRGNVGQANYSAAKAGIIGLTKANAKEFGRYNITVNAIAPNAKTRMVESIPEDVLKSFAKQIPLGRFGEPEEMAPAVIFLASDEGGYITGQILPVDGGFSV